eukprot:2882273-Amphidinium_carterae.1
MAHFIYFDRGPPRGACTGFFGTVLLLAGSALDGQIFGLCPHLQSLCTPQSSMLDVHGDCLHVSSSSPFWLNHSLGLAVFTCQPTTGTYSSDMATPNEGHAMEQTPAVQGSTSVEGLPAAPSGPNQGGAAADTAPTQLAEALAASAPQEAPVTATDGASQPEQATPPPQASLVQDDDLPDFDAIDREEAIEAPPPSPTTELAPSLGADAPAEVSTTNPAGSSAEAPPVETGAVAGAEEVVPLVDRAPPRRITYPLPDVLGGTAVYVGGNAPGWFPNSQPPQATPEAEAQLQLTPEAEAQLQLLREQVAEIVRQHRVPTAIPPSTESTSAPVMQALPQGEQQADAPPATGT